MAEYNEALVNLETRKLKVDYVLTHEAPADISVKRGRPANLLSNFLYQLRQSMTFERWYCGHLHVDETFDKVRVLYYDIVPLGE